MWIDCCEIGGEKISYDFFGWGSLKPLNWRVFCYEIVEQPVSPQLLATSFWGVSRLLFPACDPPLGPRFPIAILMAHCHPPNFAPCTVGDVVLPKRSASCCILNRQLHWNWKTLHLPMEKGEKEQSIRVSTQFGNDIDDWEKVQNSSSNEEKSKKIKNGRPNMEPRKIRGKKTKKNAQLYAFWEGNKW